MRVSIPAPRLTSAHHAYSHSKRRPSASTSRSASGEDCLNAIPPSLDQLRKRPNPLNRYIPVFCQLRKHGDGYLYFPIDRFPITCCTVPTSSPRASKTWETPVDIFTLHTQAPYTYPAVETSMCASRPYNSASRSLAAHAIGIFRGFTRVPRSPARCKLSPASPGTLSIPLAHPAQDRP